MALSIYQADAFTDKVFSGNPAAVCPMDSFPSDEYLQNIAAEMNLSETAFIVPDEKQDFQIRWFTPAKEVSLCGHATLAAAHIVFSELQWKKPQVKFISRHSGVLTVLRNEDNYYTMDFPADDPLACQYDYISELIDKEVHESYRGSDDLMLVLESEADVASCRPDLRKIAEKDFRALVVTARGRNLDFVSRVFVPSCGIDEDPVTGSAHTLLTPYWSKKTGKTKHKAAQIGKRGGKLNCELKGSRVLISGHAVSFLKGEIL